MEREASAERNVRPMEREALAERNVARRLQPSDRVRTFDDVMIDG
jgi:hypothetical protein